MSTPAEQPWRPAYNGAGKRNWFLYRDAPEVRDRYLNAANGRLLRFTTYEAAWQRANQLNRPT